MNDDTKLLASDLSPYDPVETVALLAGLLTVPQLQSVCLRLESLVALALEHCHGRKRATIRDAERWFSALTESRRAVVQDPPEDVFVSLVYDERDDYRIIEGTWEGSAFYTQLVTEVVRTMPDERNLGQVKRSVRALLALSDIVCSRAGLERYLVGSDEDLRALPQCGLPGRATLIFRTTFSFSDLAAQGVRPADLEPFLLQRGAQRELGQPEGGYSRHDRYPLVVLEEEHLIVARPSAMSVAVRDFAIGSVLSDPSWVDAFDRTLARRYSKHFSETPILGGPTTPGVGWTKEGAHRWSGVGLQFDEGHFVVCQFFLPSVLTHARAGFDEGYVVDASLRRAFRNAIDRTTADLTQRPDFRRGLLVAVGCDWGRACVMEEAASERPKWHFQSMSAADFVRLGGIRDVDPRHVWRLLDGLKTTTEAGVTIINPSGLLNLIGWARRNGGHLVPHAELPGPKVTPDRPLLLVVPPDLLRDLRADTDQRHDRHHSVDGIGRRHELRRAPPNGSFLTESSRLIYGSVEAARRGEFISVYEGARSLWLTVLAPNIGDREVRYRLWTMANEWLHRVGSALDGCGATRGQQEAPMVVVEFQDSEPPSTAGERPRPADLCRLCIVEKEGEGTCKVVFLPGFLSGFRLAKNVAERLLVRHLARAFLRLLDVEDEEGAAQAIEAAVVRNDDARSFHIFHAHGFLDYVRSSLRRELVEIDPQDDAEARIGLARISHGVI